MSFRTLRALCVTPLLLAGCKARDIPRSPAPWITLGASNGVVTSMDTSRIVREPATRVVWIRQTHRGAASTETRHRVNCGVRTVADLGAPDSAFHPMAEHRYGKRVFPTVCNALGNLPAPR